MGGTIDVYSSRGYGGFRAFRKWSAYVPSIGYFTKKTSTMEKFNQIVNKPKMDYDISINLT
jgi:hypothetical protein